MRVPGGAHGPASAVGDQRLGFPVGDTRPGESADAQSRSRGVAAGRQGWRLGYWSGETVGDGVKGSVGAIAPAATFCQIAPPEFVANPRFPVEAGSIGTAVA